MQWLGEEVHVCVVCIRSFLSYLDSATVLYFSTSTYWQCRFMFVLGGVILFSRTFILQRYSTSVPLPTGIVVRRNVHSTLQFLQQ